MLDERITHWLSASNKNIDIRIQGANSQLRYKASTRWLFVILFLCRIDDTVVAAPLINRLLHYTGINYITLGPRRRAAVKRDVHYSLSATVNCNIKSEKAALPSVMVISYCFHLFSRDAVSVLRRAFTKFMIWTWRSQLGARWKATDSKRWTPYRPLPGSVSFYPTLCQNCYIDYYLQYYYWHSTMEAA